MPEQFYQLIKNDHKYHYDGTVDLTDNQIVDPYGLGEGSHRFIPKEPDAGILLCVECKSEAARFCIANENNPDPDISHTLKPALAFIIGE